MNLVVKESLLNKTIDEEPKDFELDYTEKLDKLYEQLNIDSRVESFIDSLQGDEYNYFTSQDDLINSLEIILDYVDREQIKCFLSLKGKFRNHLLYRTKIILNRIYSLILNMKHDKYFNRGNDTDDTYDELIAKVEYRCDAVLDYINDSFDCIENDDFTSFEIVDKGILTIYHNRLSRRLKE